MLRVCLSRAWHACTECKVDGGAENTGQEYFVFVQNSSVGDPTKGHGAEATERHCQVISPGQACPDGQHMMPAVRPCFVWHSCLSRHTSSSVSACQSLHCFFGSRPQMHLRGQRECVKAIQVGQKGVDRSYKLVYHCMMEKCRM